jgi:hypothetical protein
MRASQFHFMLSSILFYASTNIWRPSGARCRRGTVSRDCIPGSEMSGLRPGFETLCPPLERNNLQTLSLAPHLRSEATFLVGLAETPR